MNANALTIMREALEKISAILQSTVRRPLSTVHRSLLSAPRFP